MLRRYFNQFTFSGGGSLLVGLGQWLSNGGLDRPIPTPVGYWVGVGLMAAGVILTIYGWRYGAKRIREHNEDVLDSIKSLLTDIDKCERDAAIKKGKESHSQDIAKQLRIDVTEAFSNSLAFIASALHKGSGKIDMDYFLGYYERLATILDTENYGLKSELAGTSQYETLNADLTKARTRLQVRKKRRALIGKNIDRISTLTYGINSFIIHKEILKSVPQVRHLPKEMLMKIEAVDTAMRQLLPKMLDDLDKEWEWEVDINAPTGL